MEETVPGGLAEQPTLLWETALRLLVGGRWCSLSSDSETGVVVVFGNLLFSAQIVSSALFRQGRARSALQTV